MGFRVAFYSVLSLTSFIEKVFSARLEEIEANLYGALSSIVSRPDDIALVFRK